MDKQQLQTLLAFSRGGKGWDHEVLEACLDLSRHAVSTAIPAAPKAPRIGTPEDPAPLMTKVVESLQAAIDELEVASIPGKVRWSLLVEWALQTVTEAAVFQK